MATITWKGTTSADYNTTANWEGDVAPGAGDTIIFSPNYSNPLTDNVDLGTTAISEVIVEAGYTADIGADSLPFKATFSKFRYSGSGNIWVDFGTSSGVDPVVTHSLPFQAGEYAVHLQGDIDNLTVSGGSVIIAENQDAAATIASLHMSAGRVKVSSRTTTFTSLTLTGGRIDTDATVGTVRLMNGTLVTGETAVVSTSLKTYGGQAVLHGTGTYTLVQVEENGIVNFTGNGSAKTVTTMKQNGGALYYDPEVITITTDTAPDRVVLRSISNV